MTTIRLAQILALCFCSLAFTAAADETQSSASDPGKGDDAKTEQEEILVTTEHSTTINGARSDYQATAGKLVMKSADLKSRADVFFVAYTRETDDPRKRPITFCFNGGPGSSSVWLHLGMLGPKRIRFPDDASTLRPPYQLESNPFSLLDLTDLVFIDPVSTGYSRPVEDVEKSEFHGFDEDVRSVGQFIHNYTTRFERWSSPKLLCGESYGGVRAAGLSGYRKGARVPLVLVTHTDSVCLARWACGYCSTHL